MKHLPTVLFFVALTFCCWGSYGPTLDLGVDAMGHSLWRPFLCVGLAYFFVAAIGPLLVLRGEEQGRWTITGIFWSFLAGAVGALGALGVVLAFKAGAKAIYVMPIVFGAAPVLNTLVTMVMNQTHRRASVPFFLAIALVAVGAAGVMRYKPMPTKAVAATDSAIEADGGGDDQRDSDSTEAEPPIVVEYDRGIFEWFTSIFSIVMTAICWGAYGPILHLGQERMEGSRLRPFICVGLAYFFVGVLVPFLALTQLGEAGHWSVIGTWWSLTAGAVGAIGALCVILAFNSGGKPVFVMPLVFGGAPIINTIDSVGLSYWKTGEIGEISQAFLWSLGLVITGAVCVLLFAPRSQPQPDADEPPTTTEPPAELPGSESSEDTETADSTTGSNP